MFMNEDVTVGSWMLALDVVHEHTLDLCAAQCTKTHVAVFDLPECSGAQLKPLAACHPPPSFPPRHPPALPWERESDLDTRESSLLCEGGVLCCRVAYCWEREELRSVRHALLIQECPFLCRLQVCASLWRRCPSSTRTPSAQGSSSLVLSPVALGLQGL